MAPVLAITSLVARTSLYRPFDPVGEFLKPFITGPNRILIPTKENGDEDGQKAVAKSQGEEGTGATIAIASTLRLSIAGGEGRITSTGRSPTYCAALVSAPFMLLEVTENV